MTGNTVAPVVLHDAALGEEAGASARIQRQRRHCWCWAITGTCCPQCSQWSILAWLGRKRAGTLEWRGGERAPFATLRSQDLAAVERQFHPSSNLAVLD